tara:strand:- start:6024 stop:6425 length:402 start_codon:yes stop_codon:yes gene_type:complete
MPPLYWAGRFQARFDQWRTEAMMVELNPGRQSESEGQLSQCKLSQEKLAACYIFAQLRDLCLTEQAADSLWVRTNSLSLFMAGLIADYAKRYSNSSIVRTTSCSATLNFRCTHLVSTTTKGLTKEPSDEQYGS